MSLRQTPDVPLRIVSDNSSGEQRITPSWTIALLKRKLELITGVPPSAQRLTLRLGDQDAIPVHAADEEGVQLASFPLQPYAEIFVTDTRPPAERTDYTDISSVEKYTMPEEVYSDLSDSVLAWKRNNKLGRFDPNAPAYVEQKLKAFEQEAVERGVEVGRRCRVGGEDVRRGTIRYVGDVPEIPNAKGLWVGVALDEPLGKNDGTISGKRYFDCGEKCGVFVRPERVEVGDFPVLDDLEEMEEI